MTGLAHPAENPLGSILKACKEHKVGFGGVCIYATEGMHTTIRGRICHRDFITACQRPLKPTWHVEYLWYPKARDRASVKRYLNLLFDPQISPYGKLVSFIKTDPIFQWDEDVLVFSPDRCINEGGFSARFLLNFMVAVRVMREKPCIFFSSLRALPRNDVWTLLSVILLRSGPVTRCGHDIFEHRTSTRLQSFVDKRINKACRQSTTTFRDSAQSKPLFYGPIWDRYQVRGVKPPNSGRYGLVRWYQGSNARLFRDYLKEVYAHGET